jgi:hypothetical protein
MQASWPKLQSSKKAKIEFLLETCEDGSEIKY